MKNFGESQLRMKIYKNIYLNLPPYIFEPADREMNLDCFPASSGFGSGGRASIWLLWQWAIQKQVRTRERARFGSIVVESILRVDLNPLVESRRIQFLADARQIGFLSLNHFCFICYFVLKIKTNLFKIYFSIVHFAQFDAQYRPVGSSESSFFICKIILTKLQFFPIYV